MLNNNSNLFKWGINESDVCEYCDEDYIDNSVHALASCDWSRQKTLDISTDLGLKDIFRQITKTEFIFGTEDICINNIILIIKYLLHTSRQCNTQISPIIVRNEIYNRIASDLKTMKSHKFKEKWKNFNVLVRQTKQYMEDLAL